MNCSRCGRPAVFIEDGQPLCAEHWAPASRRGAIAPSDIVGRERLVDSLAHLASLTIQERHVVHGTADEYLLPREMLLNFGAAYEQFGESWSLHLDTAVLRSIRELDRALDEGFDAVGSYTHETADQLIHADPCWNRIRQLAGEALVALGFDLERWEQEYE